MFVMLIYTTLSPFRPNKHETYIAILLQTSSKCSILSSPIIIPFPFLNSKIVPFGLVFLMTIAGSLLRLYEALDIFDDKANISMLSVLSENLPQIFLSS